MNRLKVSRDKLNTLSDLPNIAKAGVQDLLVLGVQHPNDLIGRCPYQKHQSLCDITGIKHDVCVIDVFISITRFMLGDQAKPWWVHTSGRKAYLSQKMKDKACRCQRFLKRVLS